MLLMEYHEKPVETYNKSLGEIGDSCSFVAKLNVYEFSVFMVNRPIIPVVIL